MTEVNSYILAGDTIDLKNEKKNKIILGPGLRISSEKVVACASGLLEKKDPNTYWINYAQKRYVPNKGENVIGIATNKSGDIFKLDIGSSEQACISYLAFEGATKKNRPEFQVGDLIYGKLIMSSKDMEPEMVCVNRYGKKEKLGILPLGGFLFSCSLNLVRKILNPKNKLIGKLGEVLPHEIAIGMNGKIWVRAQTRENTIALCNVILASEHVTEARSLEICDRILNKLRINQNN